MAGNDKKSTWLQRLVAIGGVALGGLLSMGAAMSPGSAQASKTDAAEDMKVVPVDAPVNIESDYSIGEASKPAVDGKSSKKTFAASAKANSSADAGIRDGDLVRVREREMQQGGAYRQNADHSMAKDGKQSSSTVKVIERVPGPGK